MGRRSPLTDADKLLIAVALRKTGSSRTRAAAESAYPIHTVCCYCVRHKVPLPFTIFDWTRKCGPASKEHLLLALLQRHGNDPFAVGAKTGCCITTVCKWAWRW
jgi:hypothetical protein